MKCRVYEKAETSEQSEQAEIWLVEILMSTLYCVQILDDYITQPKPKKLGCRIPNLKYKFYIALAFSLDTL